jgi:hypothetical protein
MACEDRRVVSQPPHGPEQPYQPPPGYQQPYGYGYGPYPPPQPQGYWQPPPRIDPKDLKPSRHWYWLSAIPAVIGVILAIVFLVRFVEEIDPDIDNFQTNQGAVLEFNEGARAIYIQTRENGRTIFAPPNRINCSVTSVATGERVTLDRAGSSTLDVNTDSYEREFSFDAPSDGSYRVLCEGPRNTQMAIGPDLSFGLFAPLIWAILAFVLGPLIGGAIAIVTLIRRSNHKSRLQREARERQASGLA